MKETIVIGKITGAHGIKGEIRVYPLTDDSNRFFNTPYFLCEGNKYEITGVRKHKENVLLTSPQIKDRNDAELLKGKLIEVRREDAVKLEEGEYFIEDMKGLKAYDTSSEKTYILNDIFTAGSTDVLEFKNGDETVLLPFLNENVSEVNISKGYVKADMSKGVKA